MANSLDVKESLAISQTSHPVLTLDRIYHHFGDKRVVDNASLRVYGGEILCLVGPSGCGKTTLLRIAAGLEPLQSGIVQSDAIDSLTRQNRNQIIPPEKRNIGLVFQDYALFPHLSVLDNVRFGLWRLPRQERRRRALDMLAQVDLTHQAHVYPHQLSGGQQQRVALARALAPRPSVLLLDEPFNGLNVELRHTVREKTLAILRRHRLAAILVTHDPQEAMSLGDRVAVMKDGQITQCGTPLDLYTQPINGFVMRFFGLVNQFNGVVEKGAVRTPFGTIRVGYDPCGCCLSDGKPVEVLIRPEGLSVDPRYAVEGDVTCKAIVEEIRRIGPNTLIHLRIDERTRILHYVAQIPGTVLPSMQQQVALRLNTQQAFVFPLEPCTFDP